MEPLATMTTPYVLAISSAWPPMANGSGYAMKALIDGLPNIVAVVPRVPQDGGANHPWVIPRLRFSGRAGGPFKVFSALQHLEILSAPLRWCLRSRRRRPSLIVCNQPLFSGVSGLLARRLFGIPYIVLGLGEEFTTIARDRKPFQVRRRLLRHTLRHASVVVCISRNTRRLVAELYDIPPGNLEVIYPSVDVAELSAIPDASAVAAFRKTLTGREHVLLTVGRLAEAHKGFDTAIEALPAILREVPDTTLLIAGPGSQERLTELAHRLGVQDHVRFLGLVERTHLLMLYAACDVFLLPGREVDGSAEGFGIVFLEAAFAGKPVIGGRQGGVPEAVADGETGLLVDGASVAEVAEAAVRLLRDPICAQRLGASGRRRVMEQFDGRAQRESFARIVDRVLQRTGR